MYNNIHCQVTCTQVSGLITRYINMQIWGEEWVYYGPHAWEWSKGKNMYVGEYHLNWNIISIFGPMIKSNEIERYQIFLDGEVDLGFWKQGWNIKINWWWIITFI